MRLVAEILLFVADGNASRLIFSNSNTLPVPVEPVEAASEERILVEFPSKISPTFE